jgi:hypothetical protein
MSRKTDIGSEEGSSNVYTDLGYTDAAEMQRKSQLAAEIARATKARRLTQQGAAGLCASAGNHSSARKRPPFESWLTEASRNSDVSP